MRRTLYFLLRGFSMKTSNNRINWVIALILISFSLSLVAQNTENNQNAAANEGDQSTENAPWRVDDYQPYVKSLKELEKLSKDYGEKILQQAIDEYSTGMDLLHDMEAEVENTKRRFSKQNNLNERWYWQEIDRQNQEKRQISRIKYEAKLKAVTYFTRAINDIDKIQNAEVQENDQFVEFKSRLYRAYVSSQYDIQNLKPCIPVLERYIAINDETKKDKWAYKYLASCYGFMEVTLSKYNTSISEDLITEYKQKKNQALLTAAELEYGIDSVEYRSLKEVVELDEKKSEQINDFR